MLSAVNSILLPASGQTPISMLAWFGLLVGVFMVTIGIVQRFTKMGGARR